LDELGDGRAIGAALGATPTVDGVADFARVAFGRLDLRLAELRQDAHGHASRDEAEDGDDDEDLDERDAARNGANDRLGADAGTEDGRGGG
jgi:hypothetical protein